MPVKNYPNVDSSSFFVQFNKKLPIPCLKTSSDEKSYNQNNFFYLINKGSNIQTSNFSINEMQNKTSIIKKPFTNIEDEILLSLVKMYGPRKWQKISLQMKKLNYNRNGRQCRDRYYHYLDPHINIGNEWSQQEDELILDTVDKIGKKWKSMEKMFVGRTEVALRNRYNLLIRKKTKENKLNEKKSGINIIGQKCIQKDEGFPFNFEIFKEFEEDEFENSLIFNSNELYFN